MTRDPEFLATCEKRNIMLDVGSGDEMSAIVQETMQTPKPVLSKIQSLLNL
jgi:hypothetical protein